MRGFISVSEQKYKKLLEAQIRLEIITRLLEKKKYVTAEDLRVIFDVNKEEEREHFV